jgi:hypothetical protein
VNEEEEDENVKEKNVSEYATAATDLVATELVATTDSDTDSDSDTDTTTDTTSDSDSTYSDSSSDSDSDSDSTHSDSSSDSDSDSTYSDTTSSSDSDSDSTDSDSTDSTTTTTDTDTDSDTELENKAEEKEEDRMPVKTEEVAAHVLYHELIMKIRQFFEDKFFMITSNDYIQQIKKDESLSFSFNGFYFENQSLIQYELFSADTKSHFIESFLLALGYDCPVHVSSSNTTLSQLDNMIQAVPVLMIQDDVKHKMYIMMHGKKTIKCTNEQGIINFTNLFQSFQQKNNQTPQSSNHCYLSTFF